MERILIIDDSVLQTKALRDILADDYEVACCLRGREGLEKAAKWKPSLILLDVIMPELDGFMILERLKKDVELKEIPVIMITSLTDVGSEEKGLTMGAVDYITKPFYSLIVRARVHTHVQLYSYQKLIKEQAMIDKLTGIPNRRSYDERSMMEWQNAVLHGKSISIAVLDIDRFKIYNDTYGHPAGDQALRDVAEAIAACVKRPCDFAGRYGGEEFIVLIVGETAESAFQSLNGIRRAVEELKIPFSVLGQESYVTISAGGVTVFPGIQENYITYLKIADMMLYDAKRLGRNRVVWLGEKGTQWIEEPGS